MIALSVRVLYINQSVQTPLQTRDSSLHPNFFDQRRFSKSAGDDCSADIQALIRKKRGYDYNPQNGSILSPTCATPRV
ncbi:hypothetical protein CY34DRAFT_800317, partial [Suillus luteus UH-Slu-Lm8-n1]